MKRAFTLIELLIVAAILAILAAIALPNFLEAQTRSKVARMAADMRSLASAMETYHVDWGCYPRNPSDNMCMLVLDGLPELTTPAAYISRYPMDIFHWEGERVRPIVYGTCSSAQSYWYVYSYGPDRKNQYAAVLYDPTNGTVSAGDLKRTTARDVLAVAPQ